MTDNIFEIEATALAQVACAPQESGILLKDFAAAYTSVNHAWIRSVIDKTELPDFISRGQMTALAPAFHSVDHIAGLNLNYRKCCWVQYGNEERESLCHWISEKCGEFREMQNVRHANYVGTMIGPDGHTHRRTAPRKNSSSAC